MRPSSQVTVFHRKHWMEDTATKVQEVGACSHKAELRQLDGLAGAALKGTSAFYLLALPFLVC